MRKENKTPIFCDCCGKRIIKGRPIYKIKGRSYCCCSAECLLYVSSNYYTEESTGFFETQDEEEE